jgi:hypothetical protein
MRAIMLVCMRMPDPVGVPMVVAMAMGVLALLLVSIAAQRTVGLTIRLLLALDSGFALPAPADCTHGLSPTRQPGLRRIDKQLIFGDFAGAGFDLNQHAFANAGATRPQTP